MSKVRNKTCACCSAVEKRPDRVRLKYGGDFPSRLCYCKKCGGDLDADDSNDRAFVGEIEAFEYDRWIKKLEETLSPENVTKLKTLSYLKQCVMVDHLFAVGVISYGPVRTTV